MSAVATATAVRAGRLSAVARTTAALDAVDRHNGRLNAFVRLDADAALRAAAQIDARVAAGEDPGPLAGCPIGVKDLEACRGFPLTQGSWFLKDRPPEAADSRHVARLRAAGAVVLDVTAASEFGMDSATNTVLYGVTRNPWNPEKTPGGSSGGSAAAVAAGMVPLATASDGGGSIREPAAFTGLIGLKPSHGRIPRADGFSQWSVAGALARTVADAARHLDVAAGPHDGDRQSLPAVDFSYERAIETLDVRGLRAVWSRDFGYAPVDDEVAALAESAARRLMAAAGLDVRPTVFHATNIYRHWGAIFGANLEADFVRDGILPHGFDRLSPAVQRVVAGLRSRTEPPDLKAAWEAVYALEQEVAAFFVGADLLFSPATACAPYGAADPIPSVVAGRDASETGAEPFGMLANACWLPSISIPAGLTADGLPVGLQVTGRRHRDDVLLRLARIAETTAPWSFPPGA